MAKISLVCIVLWTACASVAQQSAPATPVQFPSLAQIAKLVTQTKCVVETRRAFYKEEQQELAGKFSVMGGDQYYNWCVGLFVSMERDYSELLRTLKDAESMEHPRLKLDLIQVAQDQAERLERRSTRLVDDHATCRLRYELESQPASLETCTPY